MNTHILDFKKYASLITPEPFTVCGIDVRHMVRGVPIATKLEPLVERDDVCPRCVKALTVEHLQAKDSGKPEYRIFGGRLLHVEDLTAAGLSPTAFPRFCGATGPDTFACWFPEGWWADESDPLQLCEDCEALYDLSVQLAAYKERWQAVRND